MKGKDSVIRQISILVSAILAALCLSTGAWAQSPKAIDAALVDYSSKVEALGAIEKNLSDMNLSVNEGEYMKVDRFLNQLANTAGYSNTLLMVSYIYTVMVDQRDAASVRRYLTISCNSFNIATDRAISTANQILPKLATISLIQEITRGRDLLEQLGQSQLCRIVPTKNSPRRQN